MNCGDKPEQMVGEPWTKPQDPRTLQALVAGSDVLICPRNGKGRGQWACLTCSYWTNAWITNSKRHQQTAAHKNIILIYSASAWVTRLLEEVDAPLRFKT